MEYRTEELAKEFLEEFYRLGRMAQSRTISHSMKGEAFMLLYLLQKGEGATPGELGRALKSGTEQPGAEKSGNKEDGPERPQKGSGGTDRRRKEKGRRVQTDSGTYGDPSDGKLRRRGC